MASQLIINEHLNDYQGETNPIASHSPNVLQFDVIPDGKDIDKVEVRVEIQSPSLTTHIFEVTGQDKAGAVVKTEEFRFDFMQVFKIISTSTIQDNFQLNNFPYYYQDEAELFNQVELEVIVYFTDLTQLTWNSETDYSSRYGLLNAVVQMLRRKGALLHAYETRFVETPFLLPRPKVYDTGASIDNTNNLKIFKGYPLDIAFIQFPSPADMTLTMRGTANVFPWFGVAYDEKSALMRIALSFGNAELIGLTGGDKFIFDLEYSVTPNKHVVNVEVVDKKVIYLKWLNSLGTWSYWGFNCEGIERLDMKTKLSVVELFDTMRDQQSNRRTITKERKKSLKVYDQHLKRDELDFVNEIAESLHVYLWTADKGTAYQHYYWTRVDVEKYKKEIKQKAHVHSCEFDLTFPTQYAQTH